MKKLARNRQPSFRGSRRINAVIAGMVAVTIGAVSIVLLSTHASGVGTLTLNPASSTVDLNSNITVTIYEDSSTTAINTVEADLTYDQTKLQFVSIDTSASPFNGLVARSTGGNGMVFLSDGTTTPMTGQQIVGMVTFKAIATGSTPITFATTSGIAESTTHTDILGTTTSAVYTIVDNTSDTTAPSVPGTPTLSSRTSTSLTFIWKASTDNVGVKGYKIYRGGVEVGTSTTTSYTDNGLTANTNYMYTIAAYDASGNTSAQSTAAKLTTAKLHSRH